MEKSMISVIIPNYNYAKFVRKTVESVFAQSYRNFEVIVVDDGSNDGSIEILREYGASIRLIEQKNQGVGRARNRGAKAAAGAYLAFLDADDLWQPNKLELQMERFFSDPHVGLVHCALQYVDREGRLIGENRNGKEGYVAEDLLKLKEGVVIGAGSTAVVRREIFERIGGFDERLSTAADWEFCYRVARETKVAFVELPLMSYRIHNSNMHSNVKAMENDVMIGFEKAFAVTDPSLERIKNECFGNFYSMLAGSYFRAGDYLDFCRTAVASIRVRPQTISRFLTFPIRKLQRLRGRT